MKTINSTPKKDGFRMPGEFEKHDGTYIIWPQRPDNWRFGGKPAQQTFVKVAEAISKFEPVTVLVNHDQYANARHMLPDNVRLIEASNNDSWIRDCGATFVTDGKEVRGIDWDFNAWGGLVDGLYFPWDLDDAIAQKMCEIERKDRYKAKDFILEGGSIHVDGEGTLVTTEECLLSDGRNSSMTKSEIENTLKEYLNLEKIIWLKRGIYLDETNGHVDNIFSFVSPGNAILAWTDDESDPQYEICKECLDILENETDAKGRKINVTKLYLPKPILITKEESLGVDAVDGTLPRQEGDRLAASYANFYIANNAVIYPKFNDPNDTIAEETLKKVFPDREVVGIYAREILLGGGNIHCITQQVPSC
ncbi:MAG: agmatine deiminase [Clostridia bacterium]|nr:agmatine deiminase [Clostridia bacterium]